MRCKWIPLQTRPERLNCSTKRGIRVRTAISAPAYNSGMRTKLPWTCGLGFLLVALGAYGQSVSGAESLSIPVENLPKPSLWAPYFFRLPASGGIGLYHWHLISGSLPTGLKLNEAGEFAGTPQETGQSEFNLLLTDSDSPPKQQKKKFTLSIETPLAVAWSRKANVSGQRIEGSIKVSNHTGRDFDLTVIVLAVNEIGRATAIGYQHFSLKKNTRDQEIPFGDTLSRGDYQVNVDVVAEEPVSNRIFRARLVTGKERVTE
jgi:Putative Ig domain